MQQLPAARRNFIRARADVLWLIVREALNELADRVAAGCAPDASDLILRPHSVMRRLLRQRRLRELQQALDHVDKDEW